MKCLELEDVLKDQGCDNEEIEEKVEAYQQMLLRVEQDKGAFQDVNEFGQTMAKDSHQLAQAQNEKNAVLKNSQSKESLSKIDYKCKLCKFETLEMSSLKSHTITGHKVNEAQTYWNKYISLCKRVIIANPEPGSEPGPKLKPSSLRNLSLKKRKLEPEAKYIPTCQEELNNSLPDQDKERSESHLTLSKKDKKLYKCDKCGTKFSEQNSLDQHNLANLHLFVDCFS